LQIFNDLQNPLLIIVIDMTKSMRKL